MTDTKCINYMKRIVPSDGWPANTQDLHTFSLAVPYVHTGLQDGLVFACTIVALWSLEVEYHSRFQWALQRRIWQESGARVQKLFLQFAGGVIRDTRAQYAMSLQRHWLSVHYKRQLIVRFGDTVNLKGLNFVGSSCNHWLNIQQRRKVQNFRT